MEGLQPLHRRVAGIDVHRMLHVVTVLIEQPDGSITRTSREYGGFRRDCRALAAWLAELGVELVVMESTGIYWKSVFAHLERAGIRAWVDHQEAHLKAVFAFLGITDLTVIRAEGLAVGPDVRAKAIDAALAQANRAVGRTRGRRSARRGERGGAGTASRVHATGGAIARSVPVFPASVTQNSGQ